MRTNIFIKTLGCLSLISMSHLVQAQDCTESSRKEATEKIASLIADHYFDMDKGTRISASLKTEAEKGSFRNANDWTEFDARLSKTLNDISKDAHLFVRYDPSTVSSLKTKSGAPDERSDMSRGGVPVENNGITETTILDGNIAYMKLTTLDINAETVAKLKSVMSWFKATKAMIIDLRDNGGGASEEGPVFESYFLPAGEPLLSFKNRKGHLRTDSTLSWVGDARYDQPLYIIVNKKTASAAEALAFTLQQKKRAQIIGERTAGAANKTEWFVVNDGSYVSVSVESPLLAGTEKTWEQKGITPDIRMKGGDPVSEVVSRLHKD